MTSFKSLYRSLLKEAVAIDEMGVFKSGISLDNLVRTRGRYLFTDISENEAESETSYLSGAEKASLFLDSMKMIRTQKEVPRLVTSCYSAMLSGKGDYNYRKHLEDGLLFFMNVKQHPDFRIKLDESYLADCQNRILQKAVSLYASRLALISEGLTERSDAAIKVTVLDLPEKVVVDVEDETEKQVIYVYAEGDIPEAEIEGATVAPVEKLPGATVHQSIFTRAQRIFESILQESDLHRGRKTFLVGHGLGGAIITVISMLLVGERFEVANTILLGPYRAVESLQKKHADQLNCIRVVAEGDPCVVIPSSSDRHMPFVNVGETLFLHPKDPEYSIHKYQLYLADENIPLSYSDEPEEDNDFGSLRDLGRKRRQQTVSSPR